ncbi:MAG: hypothetical protein QXJ17_00405 [Nitrososphaeria archaeon]
MNTHPSKYEGRRRHARKYDPLGTVSFGVFVIVLAIIWYNNPNLPNQFVNYFKSFEIYGKPVVPPPQILNYAATFSLYYGTWLIVLGALRISLRIGVFHTPSNIAEGVFLVILHYYILDTIRTGADFLTLVAFFIVGLGVAIIAGVIGQTMMRQY